MILTIMICSILGVFVLWGIAGVLVKIEKSLSTIHTYMTYLIMIHGSLENLRKDINKVIR